LTSRYKIQEPRLRKNSWFVAPAAFSSSSAVIYNFISFSLKWKSVTQQGQYIF